MGLKRSAEKSGQALESERIAGKLTACYVRLRQVNEEIRARRSRNELPGFGDLMGEQRELLQRIEGLRKRDLPAALLHEEMAEKDQLPEQIEDLQRQISKARSSTLEEVLSEAEGFFSKLLLVGATVGNEAATLGIPPDLRGIISRARAAAEKSDIRNLERVLAQKRVALNMGTGVLIEGRAGSLNAQAMAKATEDAGFDMEADFFGPLYRDRT